MSKSKRPAKSAPKKQKQPARSLTSLLLAKHSPPQTSTSNSERALLLQAVLSGSDIETYRLLSQPYQFEEIEAVVGSWVKSSVVMLYKRLVVAMGSGDDAWIYPWLKAIIGRQILGSQDLNSLKGHQGQSQLENVLRLQGKLELFDF